LSTTPNGGSASVTSPSAEITPAPSPAPEETDYDVVVVGSGFGGSVAALRLAEKGYSVLVLEAGQRFEDEDFATTSWDVRKYLWAPQIGCYGIQRIHKLPDVMLLAGAGVGGGSLNYANTLYVPPRPFFEDKQWGHITDWQDELAPHYDMAQTMLEAPLRLRVPDSIIPAESRMTFLYTSYDPMKGDFSTTIGINAGDTGGDNVSSAAGVADKYISDAAMVSATCD